MRAKADYGANLKERSYALNGARLGPVAKEPRCDAIGMGFVDLSIEQGRNSVRANPLAAPCEDVAIDR